MRGIGKKILCGMTCAVMAFVSLGSVNLVHAEESADTTGPVIDYDSLEVAEGGTTINVGDLSVISRQVVIMNSLETILMKTVKKQI